MTLRLEDTHRAVLFRKVGLAYRGREGMVYEDYTNPTRCEQDADARMPALVVNPHSKGWM